MIGPSQCDAHTLASEGVRKVTLVEKKKRLQLVSTEFMSSPHSDAVFDPHSQVHTSPIAHVQSLHADRSRIGASCSGGGIAELTE
jgi:hypothetical protein